MCQQHHPRGDYIVDVYKMALTERCYNLCQAVVSVNISGNSANLSITSPQVTSAESPDKLVKLHIDQYVIECCSGMLRLELHLCNAVALKSASILRHHIRVI